MKYIKNFEGWFSKKSEIDVFIEKLLDIVENENIEIQQKHNRLDSEFVFNIDKKEYKFTYFYSGNAMTPGFSSCSLYVNDQHTKISCKYYKKLKKLYNKQQKQKAEESKRQFSDKLPDLSDIGRTADKYNL